MLFAALIRAHTHTCSQQINSRKQIPLFHLSPNAFDNRIYHTTACVYTPSRIRNFCVRARDNVEFIHDEHFAEHHRVLGGEAKDTMNVINKQEKRKNNNTQMQSLKSKFVCVCCHVGGCIHYSRAAFQSLALWLSHCKSILRCSFSLFSLRLMYINNTRQITSEAEGKWKQRFLHQCCLATRPRWFSNWMHSLNICLESGVSSVEAGKCLTKCIRHDCFEFLKRYKLEDAGWWVVDCNFKSSGRLFGQIQARKVNE